MQEMDAHDKMSGLGQPLAVAAWAVFCGRMLEYKCGFNWRRGGAKCQQDYSSQCPSGAKFFLKSFA